MNFSWQDYASIGNEIEAVKTLITDEIKKFPGYIRSPLLDLVLANAKYLRSGFFILCSRFGEKTDPERILKFAAVIEMFHLATLIHDDIIDDAETRRNRPALHIKCGKRIAVLTGDFLFLKCYDLIRQYTDFPLVEKLSNLALRICAGEIEQAEDLFDKKVSVKRYIKRISGKTAALFSFSFYLGALESGAPEIMQTLLAKTGYAFGISFQIIDDILDFTKKSADIGKNVQKDLKDGIYTLPVIYTLKKNNTKLNALLEKKEFSGSRLKKIIRIINQGNSVQESLRLAEKYTNRALRHADELPDCAAKDVMRIVLKRLLARDF